MYQNLRYSSCCSLLIAIQNDCEHLLKWMQYHSIIWSHYKSTGAWLNIKTFRNTKTDDKGRCSAMTALMKTSISFSMSRHFIPFIWRYFVFAMVFFFSKKLPIPMTRKIRKKFQFLKIECKCFKMTMANGNRKAFNDEITHFFPPLLPLLIPKQSPWLHGNGNVHQSLKCRLSFAEIPFANE